MVMMSWPGELTTNMSYELMNMAYDNGAKEAWTLGLTNEHLSYFTTSSEYERPEYEACANFFGRQGGKRIIKAHKRTLENSAHY